MEENGTNKVRLGEVAYARSGDKGSAATLAVFARDPGDFPWIERCLTAAVVERFFAPMGCGSVKRYVLPRLGALNFVLPGVLAGGGSRSLRVDSQGKAIGQAALEIEIEREPGFR
jgi:hypothetical protein